MKSTKTMLIATVALGALLAGSSLFAQESTNTPPPGGPPAGAPPREGFRGRGGPSIEMLTTNLSLTADQIPKVKAVIDEQREKMSGLRDLSPEDRRTKMQEMRADTMAKMKGILTDEQYAKYEKMGMRRGPGPRPRDGNPPTGDKPADDKPPQT